MNNILYRNKRYGAYEFGATGPGNRYLNNLVFGNSQPYALLTGHEKGTISADPLFANFTGTISGDYHPRAVSPAVRRGLADGAPQVDLDSRKRVEAPTIGAYESVTVR